MAENYFGLTDVGQVRSNNEDTFIAQKTADNRYVLASVIDGVGGYTGGEVAAALAREEIIQQMDELSGDIITAMISAFKLAGKRIYDRKRQEKELESMACVATLAIVDVENNQFYYAHVGDTRLYLLRDGSLVKITKDHSFVGFLEDSGRISESAAMNHPKRNEINKALGFDTLIDTDNAYIETGDSPFLSGDMLLLCSDGLTDLVDKNEIISILTQNTSLKDKATQLINAANNYGGKDNITVVLVQNNKTAQSFSATMPTPVVKKKIIEDTVTAPIQTSPAKPITKPAEVTAKKGNGLSYILGMLCLLLLASAVWLYLQWQGKSAVIVQATEQIVAQKRKRNSQEIKLQEAIDKAAGDTLILSDTAFKQPVIISDTLHIKRDTLYLKGNIVLQRDSAYSGPAMRVTSKCRSMVLEGFKFQNFDTAIALNNNEFYLRHVQFVNCRQAVQNVYTFVENKLVSSAFPYLTYRADSISNTTNKPNGSR
ncbi:protein phosphatase 2C domain-containing protein [Mucilaginibacter terrae]|uniref:protein phosphatase 2C domain-containing protein n=1 Tax=Mucilaginibacter terrae TaxID=1955052 RepID=UPI003644CF68